MLSRVRVASAKKKAVKPSPATAPHTPASSRPSSAPGGSGGQNSPSEQAAPTPDAQAQSKPVTISSDHAGERHDGGDMGGAEAESHLRQLDLEALHRATLLSTTSF